jgi:monoamine oxidase
MARTSLFSRLRRLAAAISAARSEGITDPHEIAAWVRAHPLPRREFNRTLLASLGLVAVGGGSTGCPTDDTSGGASTGTDGDTDTLTDGETTGGDGMRVAVIGGGMAGLHCAYRLAEVGVDVTVYESSDRTGGRMFTARGMFADDQVAELGGEFIDSGHLTMRDLAEELGIQLDDRQAATDGLVPDTWWVDGVAVPDATVVEQFSMVADLMAELVEMADTDDAAYEMLDNISMSDWLDDNVPPAMFPELHTILSVAYRGEYGLETAEQSILNLLYLIGADTPDEFRIFGVSDERYHTHLGSDTFPTMLADAITDRIQTGMTLISARDGENGTYLLQFMGASGMVEVEAEHVVFSLPFTRLRAVDLTGLTLTEDKRTIIAELGYGTNAKVIGGFTERVWATMHDASGSVVTDLPAQQFWDTSVGQAGASGIVTNYLGGQQGLAAGEAADAEAWFTDVALPDLDAIFPGSADAYVAGSAVLMHWPTYPHNLGSYACYRPGQWAYYGIEGAREGNLHFCGEHTSLEFQGYMEGAAETGMLAAMAILSALQIEPSPILQHMAARKLVEPHPIVHGRLRERPRWKSRRRALAKGA